MRLQAIGQSHVECVQLLCWTQVAPNPLPERDVYAIPVQLVTEEPDAHGRDHGWEPGGIADLQL